jgi:hypothetical protein
LNGVLAMKAEIDVSQAGLRKELARAVVHAVYNDHPELFWWDNAACTTVSVGDTVTSFEIPYSLTEEERQSRQAQIDSAAEKFLEPLTADMGDYETALKLFETMIGLLDYDSLTLEREKRRRKSAEADNLPDDMRSIYGALVKRRAVCAGYAAGYQYLLQRAGIRALYVTGTIRSSGEGHAWNIVELEGAFTHVDVTWGDFSNTKTGGDKYISYAYFGLTDEQIRRSRTIEEENLPICRSEACNYFVREGLYLPAYDAAAAKKMIVQELSKHPDRASLRFGSERAMRTAVNDLLRSGDIFDLLRSLDIHRQSISHMTNDKLCVLTILTE